MNVVITEKMPALYRALNEHGLRPSPGEAIEVPVKP